MPVFDPILTGVLLTLGVAAWTWFSIRDIDRVMSPLYDGSLDPLACTVTDDLPDGPDRGGPVGANLFVVAVGNNQFWACCTAGCRRVHRTRQGAEFCSLMKFEP